MGNFFEMYGNDIIYLIVTAIVTGVCGWLGVQVKALVDKYLNDKIKRDVAKTVVQAVEQVYKDMHGKEKFNEAIQAASEMLSEKGIAVTELELRMLIEAAVAEFNKAFEKDSSTDIDCNESCNEELPAPIGFNAAYEET